MIIWIIVSSLKSGLSYYPQNRDYLVILRIGITMLFSESGSPCYSHNRDHLKNILFGKVYNQLNINFVQSSNKNYYHDNLDYRIILKIRIVILFSESGLSCYSQNRDHHVILRIGITMLFS